jgi:diphthamide synthase (EF-2-diphthine--ammonia ligase)
MPADNDKAQVMARTRNTGSATHMKSEFKYFAFISYKREDEKWANWLHQKLEQYQLPSAIGKKRPELPKRLKPVFRDTTDINPGVLADVLEQNLAQSKHLIVICSPRAARSQWVGKEISEFIAQGKQNNIIPFIIDGQPYSNNPETECYHPVIREKMPEMLGVNIHEAGKGPKFIKKQKAFIHVVSKLLDVSFDTLWQRQTRRIISNLVMSSFLCIIVTAVTIAASYYQYKINKSFDARIQVREASYHNPSLPFENGKIFLCYDRDTLESKRIDHYSDTAIFNNIPGAFFGKKTFIRFRMTGFQPLDSLVILKKEITLFIKRNDRFGMIKGCIKDYSGNNVAGAKITIDSGMVTTDSNGIFNIIIPDHNQTVTKQVVIEKSGFKTIKEKYAVGTSWEILLEKQ